MKINDFVAEAHKNAMEHGFWDSLRETGTMIALIHSEVSEAVEAEDCANFVEELADICIRIADLCGGMEIDLQDVVDDVSEFDFEGDDLHLNTTSLEELEASFRKLPSDWRLDGVTELPKVALELSLWNYRYAMAVNISLSYALEEDRMKDRLGFKVGIATAFLLTLRWAAKKGYSVTEAIEAKMAKNRERPKMHGKAY